MVVVSQTTLLDAVNRALAVLGERPVTTLAGTLSADTTSALATVNEIDLDTQLHGWAFNTERTLLTPTANKIAVPANAVRIGVSLYEYPSLDITVRDDGGVMRLYDKRTNSFTITASVWAEVVTLYDFEKCPEAYKRYVTIRAARVFCDRSISDQARHVFTAQDEAAAYKALQRHEDRVDRKTIFDTWSAARALIRGQPGLVRPSLPLEFGG